ncbi:hypothetical protein V8G54_036602 [Vigna mungo]|uniref:Zinc finger PMZ-type domain-containing protein n=1 Tax=Vigna mungo TaxID=3915 RepID=A0AAQ3MI04_VIGMU
MASFRRMEGYWAESIKWLTPYFEFNSSLVLRTSELFENSLRLLKLRKLSNNLLILGVSEEVIGRESSFVKHSEEVVILCDYSKEVFIEKWWNLVEEPLQLQNKKIDIRHKFGIRQKIGIGKSYLQNQMSEERFNVVVHHAGTLVSQYPIVYVGGEKTYWSVDPDKWSYFEAIDVVKELGYLNVRDIFYCIDNMLLKLEDGKSAMNMVGIAKLLGEVKLYVVHGVDDEPELVNIEPSQQQEDQVLLLCDGSLGREGLNDDVHNEEEDMHDEQREVHVEEEVDVEEVHLEDENMDDEQRDVDVEEEVDVEEVHLEEDNMDDEQREVHVEEELVGQEVHLEEEEVHVEDYTSSVSVDSGDVHSVEGEGHEVERDVDEGEGDEGLVDVDVNVDEELRDNIEGAVSVEVSENEESGSEDEVHISHTEKNPYDRGLSDDEWESEFLPSPDESGSEDESQTCGPFGTFVMQKSMGEYKWEVGTKFRDKKEFMEAVRSYAVHGGRELKFIKNDNRRVRVRCLGAQKSCPWMAYCGYMEGCSTWQLRKVVDNHSCSRQFNIKMMNAKWLSETLDNSMQQNPDLKINEIRSKALRKWNTNVTLSKARRAKIMASDKLESSFKNQFKRNHDYAHELLKCNPGSTVQVKVDSGSGQPVFQRLYVCLKACKVSFVCCRPFIHLDGCFLKGLYKGELLTAIGRDPNDQMLPLGYAVVEVENKESWSWFLELLIKDLGGTEVGNACTFMSDQQKGLLPAIEQLLPKAEHRFCMRHMYANFRKKFSGQKLKNLMWKAAASTYPQAWEKEMLNMKEVNEEAYKHLIAVAPPRYWSRSRFTGRSVCDSLTNNMSEGFNSVILEARGKPIITMLEEIRVFLMKRWATNRTKSCTMDFDICPKIRKRLTKEANLSKNWIPRKWLLTGIPCCHAIAAMKFLNLDPENYVPIWFRQLTYEEAYASIIFPVNGHLLWERTPYVDVLPPLNRKLPGRPKKKRRRDETQMTKGGHRKKCSICREVGHKRNKCPTQHQTDLPGPSQPPPQQPTEEITQPSQPPNQEMTQQSEPPPIRPDKLPIRRQQPL